MNRFLNANHRDSPTLTLLNVLGVLNVLNVLYVLHVLIMPMDASLACWALFSIFLFFRGHIQLLVHVSINKNHDGPTETKTNTQAFLTARMVSILELHKMVSNRAEQGPCGQRCVPLLNGIE